MKNALFILSAITIGIIGAAVLVKRADIQSMPTEIQMEQQSIIPTRMEIPSIGVDARVEAVGLDPIRKSMENPIDTRDVAWYSLGYKPGEKGSAVISGHYDKRDGSPAVFYNLGKLKTGDLIYVYDQSHRLRYMVSMVERYPLERFPLDKVFNTAGTVALNLVTCDGIWNVHDQTYSKRIVVYSKLIQ